MARGAWYARLLTLAGFLAAALPGVLMWGFTVDDALIPLRYADHLAAGSGYRFNLRGPVTDGVTPLPWAPLLALLALLRPVARGSLVVALSQVKVLGGAAWALAAASLGASLARRAGERRAARAHAAIAIGIVALAFPIGAWAVSGMETGIATALATVAAVSFERPKRVAALAGCAAALRPELVVWALAIAVGAALAESRAARAVARAVAVAALPFAVCVVVRLVVFGRAAPLALAAKPSDASHGLVYAGAASVVVLTPLLALAPLGLGRAGAAAKVIALAAAVHVLVVVAVGGDWMPYARLIVPIAPSLAIVHVALARAGGGVAPAARALGALALGTALAVTGAPAGRHVVADREALIDAARPLLASSAVVAALDVGWVGAATNADIVDLAGLTDPSIATLPGGHTSKRVDVGMLLDRSVDTVILYGPPRTRAVEARIAGAELFASHYERVAELPLGASVGSYVFYRRR